MMVEQEESVILWMFVRYNKMSIYPGVREKKNMNNIILHGQTARTERSTKDYHIHIPTIRY